MSISLAWLIPSSLEPFGCICDVTKDRISFVSKAESYPRLHYFPCLSIVDRRLILNWLVRQLFRTEKPLVCGWGIWQHMSVASLPSCWLWQPLITFSWNCCLRGELPWVLLGLCNIYREKVWVWNISWLFQGSLTFSRWLLPDDRGEVSLQEWGWLSCRQCTLWLCCDYCPWEWVQLRSTQGICLSVWLGASIPVTVISQSGCSGGNVVLSDL